MAQGGDQRKQDEIMGGNRGRGRPFSFFSAQAQEVARYQRPTMPGSHGNQSTIIFHHPSWPATSVIAHGRSPYFAPATTAAPTQMQSTRFAYPASSDGGVNQAHAVQPVITIGPGPGGDFGHGRGLELLGVKVPEAGGYNFFDGTWAPPAPVLQEQHRVFETTRLNPDAPEFPRPRYSANKNYEFFKPNPGASSNQQRMGSAAANLRQGSQLSSEGPGHPSSWTHCRDSPNTGPDVAHQGAPRERDIAGRLASANLDDKLPGEGSASPKTPEGKHPPPRRQIFAPYAGGKPAPPLELPPQAPPKPPTWADKVKQAPKESGGGLVSLKGKSLSPIGGSGGRPVSMAPGSRSSRDLAPLNQPGNQREGIPPHGGYGRTWSKESDSQKKDNPPPVAEEKPWGSGGSIRVVEARKPAVDPPAERGAEEGGYGSWAVAAGGGQTTPKGPIRGGGGVRGGHRRTPGAGRGGVREFRPSGSEGGWARGGMTSSSLGRGGHSSLSSTQAPAQGTAADRGPLTPKEESAFLSEMRSKTNPRDLKALKTRGARYFIIKSYSEDDVHRSIKYGIWCSTKRGNDRLNQAFLAAKQKGNPPPPIYLFFSVNSSAHFCGMAQMMTGVDFDAESEVWADQAWRGLFTVRWIYVKDVPNKLLRHIKLHYNENKPVTNSRDTQEVQEREGLQVLKIIHECRSETSLFDDFTHYERREEQEQEASEKRQGMEKYRSVP